VDADLPALAPHEVGTAKVVLTLVEGQAVHRDAGLLG
jgi:predicted amidohydrolase YtcJ